MDISATSLKIGNQIFGAIAGSAIDSVQYQMQTAAREHRAAMQQISSAMQQNSVVRNEANIRDRSQRLDLSIQQQAIKARGAAEVSAAAAGVKGGSVDMALLGLRRSAMNAQDARLQNTESAFQAAAEQRKNIELSTIFGKDISVLVPPSPASALLGLGASIYDTIDSNSPKGAQPRDSIASWLGKKG